MVGAVLLLVTNFFLATTIRANICQTPLSVPVITSPASGTKTSHDFIDVDGTSDPDITISVIDNSVSIATITSDTNGVFGVDIPLTNGANQLIAEASDSCGDIADSSTVTVYFKKPTSPHKPSNSNTSTSHSGSQPSISIHQHKTRPSVSSGKSEPLLLRLFKLPATTTRPFVNLSGYTNMPAEITVFINSNQLAQFPTDAEGDYSARIPLYIGINHITVSAMSAGHSASIKTDITRKPVITKPGGFWQHHKYLIIIIIVTILIAAAEVIILIAKRKHHDKDDKQFS